MYRLRALYSFTHSQRDHLFLRTSSEKSDKKLKFYLEKYCFRMELFCLGIHRCLKIFDIPPDCDIHCLNALVRLGFFLEPFTNKLIFDYKKSRGGEILEEPMRRQHIRKILGVSYVKMLLIINKLTALNVMTQDSSKHFYMNPSYIRVENGGSCSDTLNLFKIEDTATRTTFGDYSDVRKFIRERTSNAALTSNKDKD